MHQVTSDPGLHAILRQYSCLAPLNAINFPKNVARQCLQDFLVASILNDDLLAAYPPSSQYRRQFWKRVIARLEENYDEDKDFELASEIYELYLDLLQDFSVPVSRDHLSTLRIPAPDKSFTTYHWVPPEALARQAGKSCLTTTLMESRNVIESGTTGLRTWTAAFFLAQYFLDNPDLIMRGCILELGSGVGFMGTVISSLQVLSGAQKDDLPKLWLTDVDETVLLTCRKNIELPCNLSSHGNVQTIRLDWFDAMDKDAVPTLRHLLREKIDPELIVGSDIVFDPALISPLLSTLKLALEGSTKTALFALTLRNETTLSSFLTSAEEFGLHVEELISTMTKSGAILSTGSLKDPDAVKLLRLSAKP